MLENSIALNEERWRMVQLKHTSEFFWGLRVRYFFFEFFPLSLSMDTSLNGDGISHWNEILVPLLFTNTNLLVQQTISFGWNKQQISSLKARIVFIFKFINEKTKLIKIIKDCILRCWSKPPNLNKCNSWQVGHPLYWDYLCGKLKHLWWSKHIRSKWNISLGSISKLCHLQGRLLSQRSCFWLVYSYPTNQSNTNSVT